MALALGFAPNDEYVNDTTVLGVIVGVGVLVGVVVVVGVGF